PVAENFEGGLADCKLLHLEVPGEDADKVYALIKLDGRRWRVDDSPQLPLLTLPPRATLSISFYDRDFWSGDDFLVTLKLARHGRELSAEWGSATRPERRGYAAMKCTLFDRDAVEAGFGPLWQRAADALDEVDEGPVRVLPDHSDLGLRESGLDRAQRLVD